MILNSEYKRQKIKKLENKVKELENLSCHKQCSLCKKYDSKNHELKCKNCKIPHTMFTCQNSCKFCFNCETFYCTLSNEVKSVKHCVSCNLTSCVNCKENKNIEYCRLINIYLCNDCHVVKDCYWNTCNCCD